MADITFGKPINGSIAATDPKLAAPNPLASSGFDEYNIAGLPSFNQVEITITPDAALGAGGGAIQVINAATGAVLTQNSFVGTAPRVVTVTSFPGINYKVQVVGAGLGTYKLEMTDAGKATSIVTPLTARNNGDGSKTDVGTIGENGRFFSLASSNADTDRILYDIALGADSTKLYGIGTNAQVQDILFKIDPARATKDQVIEIGFVKDAANNILSVNLNALAFGPDGQLYTIGSGSSKLYTIDLITAVATSVGDLPAEFVSNGDLVYDPVGGRFLAASVFESTANSSTLWSIPVATPANATKLGTIGFPGVKGLSFENGQLKGFTGGVANALGDRITIDTTTGIGTLQDKVGADSVSPINNGIGGATTITISATTPTPIPTPTPTPTPPVTGSPGNNGGAAGSSPTPATILPGTKGQSTTQRTIDLTDYAGTLKTDIKTTGDAVYTNNIGFYVVTDARTGAIDIGGGVTLKPGDAGYAKAAVASAILQASKNDSQPNQNIPGGGIYAPVVVAQGSLNDFVSNNPTNGGDGQVIHAYFNYLGANPDNFDHFKLTAPNTFAVEDQYGGGDRDFNDLIVNMNVRTA